MVNLVAGIEGVSRGKVTEIDGKSVKDYMSQMSESFDFEKDVEVTEGPHQATSYDIF